MELNFEERGHPVSEHVKRWSRILETERSTVSIHFSCDTLYFAQSIQPLSSAFTGAVADWCEEPAQHIPVQASSSIETSIAKANEQWDCSLASEEVNTLKKTPRANVPASGNRSRDHQEKFGHLPKEIRVAQTCGIAGFRRKVSPGQCFRTIHDIDDGFGTKTGACREYTTLWQ